MADNPLITRHLPEFIREGYNVSTINGAIAEELKLAINFLDGTKTNIQISTASGEYLDDIGSLFNLTRIISESDNAFRARILSYISQSASSGTSDDIRNVISNFTGLPIEVISVTDIGAGKILIETSVGTEFELADTIYDIVNKSKAAGIYAFLDVSADIQDLLSLVDTIQISVIVGGRYYGIFKYGADDSKY
jgi:hypothetical protein